MKRAALLAALALFACRRQTGPDPNYEKAAALYQQLYAAQLDDAYGDPQMDEVAALLRKVDSRSIDAPAAQTMLNAIQHGKETLAQQRAEREKLAAAVKPPEPIVNLDAEKILAASAPDAGPPPDPYGAGASIAEINAKSGGCLTENEPFAERGTNVAGIVYRLADSQTCRERLPGFAGQAVLVIGGKIYRRIPDPRPPAAAAPDAGAPASAPVAKAPPRPPPDAGEPQYQITIPGAPQPGAPPAAQSEQQR